MEIGQRTRHPFHMYDAIFEQPEALVRVLEKTGAAVDEFAARVSSCKRLFLVGIGTSYNAARVGEHLVRAYGGGLDVRAINSFDFALYGPGLTPEDCVVAISHRGSKRYTALALVRARESGCRTALVTGEAGVASNSKTSVASHTSEGTSAPTGADAVFETVAQERSSAHTVSYTGAISVLAQLARRLGNHRTGSAPFPEAFLRNELPEALRSALGTEDAVAALAREHVRRRRIWLVGGGPSAVTAEEISLKIKETSYLQAEGMPTETMLHGPFQCVEAEDLFVLVAPAGAAQGRTLEVAQLAAEIGGTCLLVGDGTTGSSAQTAGLLEVPEVPESFSALTCLLPLQLFSYHLALACGTNPDSFRAEDPRFARADVSGRL
jgi:glucosamine--fructose-6-phosphate aminotransferase (isomerizing)